MSPAETVRRKIVKAETIVRSAPAKDAATRAAFAAMLEVLNEIAIVLDGLDQPQLRHVV